MWRRIRRLFCRHEWETRQCFSMFYVWYEARCKKCGKDIDRPGKLERLIYRREFIQFPKLKQTNKQ